MADWLLSPFCVVNVTRCAIADFRYHVITQCLTYLNAAFVSLPSDLPPAQSIRATSLGDTCLEIAIHRTHSFFSSTFLFLFPHPHCHTLFLFFFSHRSCFLIPFFSIIQSLSLTAVFSVIYYYSGFIILAHSVLLNL